MRYSGNKTRFMKQLTPILMEHVDEDTIFIDAFCGGANVISAIPHPKKVGIEINRPIAMLWQHLQKHGMEGIPYDLTEEDYNSVRYDYINQGNSYPDWLVGYVGACCSYGSAWFNGYARFNANRNENHIHEAYRGLEKQLKNFKFLETTEFVNTDYLIYRYPSPDKCVIYCDPPYAGRKRYASDFDNNLFWSWARSMSKEGYHIYVSEYEAPSDFKCIWSQVKSDGMGTTKNGNKQKKEVERLFVYDK